MVIKKWIQPQEMEIDVVVTAEDIANIFAADREGDAEAMRGLNNVATFLRGLSNDFVMMLTGPQKKVVRDFLREQATRYI